MDVTNEIEYYRNLLIIQYNSKPKASATIRLLASSALANGVFWDVLEGYNIETAVGKQLDILGKYVGIDRFFNVTDPRDYFSFADYDEVDPDSDFKYGFTTYPDFEEFQYNGTMNYNSVISIENRLNDEDYRTLIKLKIIQNNSNHSHKSIDDGIFRFFGDEVRPSSNGGMKMNYFVSQNAADIVRAAIEKEVLPRPMGVGLGIVEYESGIFFGLTGYGYLAAGVGNKNITGFSSYDDYDTKVGETLSYRNMYS